MFLDRFQNRELREEFKAKFPDPPYKTAKEQPKGSLFWQTKLYTLFLVQDNGQKQILYSARLRNRDQFRRECLDRVSLKDTPN